MIRTLGACILLSLFADAGANKAAAQVPTEKKDKEAEKAPLPRAKENAPKEDGQGKDGSFRDPTQPSEALKALLSKAGMVNLIEKSKGLDNLLDIVDFQNVPLFDAMRNLSLKTGLRIAPSQDAAKTMVNLYLAKVRPEEVIETLANANNLVSQPGTQSGVILIVTQKEDAEAQKKKELLIKAEADKQERILKADQEKQQRLFKATEVKRLAEEAKPQKLLKDVEAKKLAEVEKQQKLLKAAEAKKLAMEKSVLEIFSKTTIKGRVIGHDLAPGVLLDMNGKIRLVTKNSQYSLGGDVFFRVEEVNATEVRIIAMPLNKTLVLN